MVQVMGIGHGEVVRAVAAVGAAADADGQRLLVRGAAVDAAHQCRDALVGNLQG